MSTGAAETDTQAEKVANTSGITVSSLKQALKEKLEAEYVEIEDMSGSSFYHFLNTSLTGKLRWLRPSVQCHDRLLTI